MDVNVLLECISSVNTYKEKYHLNDCQFYRFIKRQEDYTNNKLSRRDIYLVVDNYNSKIVVRISIDHIGVHFRKLFIISVIRYKNDISI